MKILAEIISTVFNPVVLLFPLPYLLVYKVSNDDGLALKWFFFSSVFLLVTCLFIMIAVKRKIFTDIDVSKREQRPLLFLFVSIIAMVYLSGLLFLQGPPILFFAITGILIGVIIFSFINLRIKASLHVASSSALIFILSILYGGNFLLLLVLIPIIAWSRVKLKRHSLSEATVGGTLGVLITLCMYLVLRFVLQVNM